MNKKSPGGERKRKVIAAENEPVENAVAAGETPASDSGKEITGEVSFAESAKITSAEVNAETEGNVRAEVKTEAIITEQVSAGQTKEETKCTAGLACENPMEQNGKNEGDSLPEENPGRRKRISGYFKKFVKRYFIDAFSGMALGLFCTLIAGTIIEQIGKLIGDNAAGAVIRQIGIIAKLIMGAGIGAGIAFSLKAKKLTTFSAAVAGMVGANVTNIFLNAGIPVWGASLSQNSQSVAAGLGIPLAIGDPVGAYIGAVFAVEIARLVEGKTPVDILVAPLTAVFAGAAAAIVLGLPFGMLFTLLGKGISLAIKLEPVSFGIIVAVVMGLLLTFPTSSAAFGVMLFAPLAGTEFASGAALAAGAACAGCCAHMVGFAVASFRENKWGGLVAQGIGTSMLQIPNLAKNMRILLPAIAASAVAGPLSSAAFGLLCDAAGSGMGTAGLVGVIQTVTFSMEGGLELWYVLVGVLVCYILVPAAVAFGVSELMRKFNWIKPGDMKLPD